MSQFMSYNKKDTEGGPVQITKHPVQGKVPVFKHANSLNHLLSIAGIHLPVNLK